MSTLIITNIITESKSPLSLHLCGGSGKCFLRRCLKWQSKCSIGIVWSYWDGLGIWLTSLPFSRSHHLCVVDLKMAWIWCSSQERKRPTLWQWLPKIAVLANINIYVAFSKRTWRTWWHPLHFFTPLRSNVNVSFTFFSFFCRTVSTLNIWMNEFTIIAEAVMISSACIWL